QDLSGKWYGKITQGPGGYASEYAFELEIDQENENLSGISFAYYKEDVVAKFNYYGFFQDQRSIVLQEDVVMEEKTPPQWVVCIKRLALRYRETDSSEYLEGEWAGIGITDGEACIPGQVFLSRDPYRAETVPRHALPADTSALLLAGPAVPEEAPGGRLLKPGSEIFVRSPDIVVKIADYQIIDGDIVTVYFNEEKVVDKQLIRKEPIILRLNLEASPQPGKLLLYAENLGRIPPNTALMVVEDSRGRQRIKLESDYERSDVIYIRYKP
ncbi:MAG TPA: hypothetical protein VD772_00225, partial [Anseongella sp.]|nr:hypothetical protein [Anseongella sp.]